MGTDETGMTGDRPEGGEAASEPADDLSALLSSATLMLFIGSLGSFSRLLEQVLIGRVLSAGVYGRVNIGISVLGIATTVAGLGMTSGIPRFMSRYTDERDIRGAWVTGAVIAAIAALVLTAAMLANLEWISTQFEDPIGNDLLALFALSTPFVVGLNVAVGAIQGRENTIYRTYVRDLFYNGFRIVLLAGFLVAGAGAIAAGYAYVVSAVAALGVAYYLFDRLFPVIGPFRLHTREMVAYSLPLVVSSTVSILLSQIDTLMLGALVPAAQVGVYSAAYTLAAGVAVVASSFGFLYFPLTSRLDAGGRRGEINRMYKLTAKWVYVISFPVVLCFIAFAEDLLLAVFGDYAGGAVALAIVSTGFFISAAQGRCQDTLSAFGFTGYILLINVGTAVLDIVLNAALIPMYGINGAAAASAIAYVTLNGVALGVLWYKSGINPLSRRSAKTFLVLPAVLIPLSVVLARYVTLTLLTVVPFLALAGVASVALLALTGSLQAEDEIPIELIEDRLGVTIPLIRRYIPGAGSEERE
jgi:O-antigen/teichoic acid export membrane protein